MKIVIVGGGFGGVRAARLIAKHTNHKVTLISERPQFQYYPALYGAATGRSSRESWFSLATLFADTPQVDVVIDRIKSVEPTSRYVVGESGERYSYQRCIFALGSKTTFFGIKGLEEFAFGIKSREEITRFKEHLYRELKANRPRDARQLFVVGGGATGVEFAASLGSYVRKIEKKLGLRRQGYKIHLVQAQSHVLPTLPKGVGRHTERRLKRLGVIVHTSTPVTSASKTRIVVNNKSYKTRTIVWTAGVAPSPFYKANEGAFAFGNNKRIKVNKHLQSSRYIYVIGDNADTPYSGLAQVAISHADTVAKNFMRAAKNKAPRPFKPKNPPVIIPVGSRYAVFSWRQIRLYGYVPALMRKAADIIGYAELMGLRRAMAVSNWSEAFEDEYFVLGKASDR